MKLYNVVHERGLKKLDILALTFSTNKFFPRSEQIFQRNAILIVMKKYSTELPVIEHMLKVYKIWYAIRDNLPKKSRYTLGDKIDSRFIQSLELLYMASYQSTADKLPTLDRALSAIDLLKFLLRVSWEIGALDDKKYINISEELKDAARQVGGWRRGIQTKTSTR